MTYYRLSTADIPRREYLIPTLSSTQPLIWLKKGWRDFTERPAVGLIYGILAAIVGALLVTGLINREVFYLVPIITAGFLLISPLLAVGLYADAKQRQHRKDEDTQTTGQILRRNLGSIGAMGIVLMLIFLNWIMLSNLLFGGVFHELMPTWESVRPLANMWTESLWFFLVYFAIGAILAALVFRMTATSVPMLVDQDVDVFNAIFASWVAV